MNRTRDHSKIVVLAFSTIFLTISTMSYAEEFDVILYDDALQYRDIRMELKGAGGHASLSALAAVDGIRNSW
ncbi:MAG: hypothetical protein R6X10_00115 [Desulfobacterales bacterium]